MGDVMVRRAMVHTMGVVDLAFHHSTPLGTHDLVSYPWVAPRHTKYCGLTRRRNVQFGIVGHHGINHGAPHGPPWPRPRTMGHVKTMGCTMVHTMDPWAVHCQFHGARFSPWVAAWSIRWLSMVGFMVCPMTHTMANHGWVHGVPRGLSH